MHSAGSLFGLGITVMYAKRNSLDDLCPLEIAFRTFVNGWVSVVSNTL